MAELVLVESCRKCCGRYDFKLENGDKVTVLCGRPNEKSSYKAVSYIWEVTQPVSLECRRCSSTKRIPMRDRDKLWTMLRLAGGGSILWLDALSIDQDDPGDKAAQLPIMGHIYQHAQTVAVMLPEPDTEAYQTLRKLGLAADAIRIEYNAINSDSVSTTNTQNLKGRTEKLTEEFLTCLTDLSKCLPKCKYWQRAWTFQEWSMASEIDVSVEAISQKESIVNIKNIVVVAAQIAKIWKTEIAQATLDNLLERSEVANDFGRYLHAVKTLFPYQDFVIGGDETDPAEMRLMSSLPVFPAATSTGTEMLVNMPTNEKVRLRCMVSLAINSIRLSEREATYAADKVYCWASICNIKVDYDQNDTYEEALHKVITSLRQSGIPIFNFSVNTDCAETDLNFLAYAGAQRSSNAVNGGHYLGSSVYVGRTDTVLLCRMLLSNGPMTITKLQPHFNIHLQPVDKALIKRPILWSDRVGAIDVFRSMVSGRADGTRILDVMPMVAKVVDDLPLDILQNHYLMTVSIGVEDIHTMWYFQAWAICPSDVPLHDLFVARESLNGTLVIAVFEDPKPATEARIVGYLYMTHQRDGTYLVKSDEQGIVDVVFRTADTPEHDTDWLLRDLGGSGILEHPLSAASGDKSNLWDMVDSLHDRAFNMKISLSMRNLPLKRRGNRN